MKLQAGSVIKSTALLTGTYFHDVSILITEYNHDGAVGFILNKPYARNLSQLEEYKHVPPHPLFEGGPVDQQHLFFIHDQPQLINGGIMLRNGIYFGGDFNQAIQTITNNHATATIKIFIGYCGWEASELEAELAEGSWEIQEENNHLLNE